MNHTEFDYNCEWLRTDHSNVADDSEMKDDDGRTYDIFSDSEGHQWDIRLITYTSTILLVVLQVVVSASLSWTTSTDTQYFSPAMSSFSPSSPLHLTEGAGQGIIGKVFQRQWYAHAYQAVMLISS